MTTEDLAATAVTEPVPLGRNRDFNLLWVGQAASALGSEISEIAYPLLILATTGSAAEAGLVGASVLIAHLLTLLPAGVVADRYPRKRIMVASSLVQLVAVATVVPAVYAGRVSIRNSSRSARFRALLRRSTSAPTAARSDGSSRCPN